jgi:zinc-ribbon domain
MADRYCRNCGHELGETDRFCPNCASPVQDVAHVPTPEADVPVPLPHCQSNRRAQAAHESRGWRTGERVTVSRMGKRRHPRR